MKFGKSWLYDHHGIFVGDQKVIHYSGMASGLSKGSVQETLLEEFIAGTAGSVASVYAFGSVAGLSGPGIASGLAAIGGGGMAVGIAVAVAVPTLAAGTTAYGVYRLAKWYYSGPTDTVGEAVEANQKSTS